MKLKKITKLIIYSENCHYTITVRISIKDSNLILERPFIVIFIRKTSKAK